MTKTKKVLMYIMGGAMIPAGIVHFIKPEFYMRIMPPFIPAPLAMVYLSGVAEIVLGAMLLVPNPKYRRLAAWGLILLYIAIYPANIYHTYKSAQTGGPELIGSIIRLPFQFLFIAWAYWYTKPDETITTSHVTA